MAEITVVLDRKELAVTLDAKTMCVNRPGGRPQRFPLSLVERVIVIGRPTVSCDVWRALSEHNIPALLLPGRGNGAVAHIGPWPSSSASTRLSQFREVANQERAIAICQWLIRAKLSGQQKILRERISERPELYPFLDRMEEAKRRIDGLGDRNSLMGVEGAAASAYFQAIGTTIDPKWGFSERNRRPPRDPVNSLLSLSYTLGVSEMRREILIAGLDLSIGFLHANQANREGLTLD